MATVLVVDDDPVLRKGVADGLIAAGHQVDEAETGAEALDRFQTGQTVPALLILDRMMPGWDGIETLQRFKRSGYTGASMFLTALDEVEERIEGLEAGADDYLVKPFSMEELVARAQARLRGSMSQSSGFNKGPFVIDLMERSCHINGNRVLLKPRELKLLHYLLFNSETICSRATLLKEVWDMEFDPGTNVVDVHISRLRKHMADADVVDWTIDAVRGKGYRMALAAE